MMLPMVDCRGLIEFCRAFEQHKNRSRFQSSKNKQSQDKNPFCSDHSPMAALDLVLLILVIGSLGFLLIPYFTSVFAEAFPILCEIVVECINDTPVEYFVGLVAALLGVLVVIVAWEILDLRSRKCGNHKCQGLRKAVEFDIQLESEECLKYLPPDATFNGNAFYNYGVKPLELGQDRKELEAELKRMAPPNGRTVLIFRAPCGCPAAAPPSNRKNWLRDVKSSVSGYMLEERFSIRRGQGQTVSKHLSGSDGSSEHQGGNGMVPWESPWSTSTRLRPRRMALTTAASTTVASSELSSNPSSTQIHRRQG